MPFTQERLTVAARVRGVLTGVFAASLLAGSVAHAQVPAPNPEGPKANWTLFNQFGTPSMRNLVFSTSITPRWIGESDSLFYNWRDRFGEHWYLVNAFTKTKKPLFDQAKLAAQLSVLRSRSHRRVCVERFVLHHQHHEGSQESSLCG